MTDLGRRAGLIAVVLGGLALFLPWILGLLGGGARPMSGYGGYGGYGGMMGGYGGMMGSYGGMMGGYGGTGLGGSLLGLVFQLGFVVLLVGGGYLLYRALVSDSGIGTMGSDSALEELRLAYARGDISDEEFERRRERLQTSGGE